LTLREQHKRKEIHSRYYVLLVLLETGSKTKSTTLLTVTLMKIQVFHFMMLL